MINSEQKQIIEYFGGSFDPLTLGGINLAQEIFMQNLARGIIFSPCGSGRHADGKKYIGSDEDRLALVKIGVDYLNINWRAEGKVAAVWKKEIESPSICRTFDAWVVLQELFPHAAIRCLIGADLLPGLHKWKNWEQIPFDIYPRQDSDMSWIPEGARVFSGPEYNGASGKLKLRIAQGESTEGWLLPEQEAYMREKGIYGFAQQPLKSEIIAE